MWYSGEFDLHVDGDLVVEGKDCLINGTALVQYEDDGAHLIYEVDVMLTDDECNEIGHFRTKEGPVYDAVCKAFEFSRYMYDAIEQHHEDRLYDYEEDH